MWLLVSDWLATSGLVQNFNLQLSLGTPLPRQRVKETARATLTISQQFNFHTNKKPNNFECFFWSVREAQSVRAPNSNFVRLLVRCPNWAYRTVVSLGKTLNTNILTSSV